MMHLDYLVVHLDLVVPEVPAALVVPVLHLVLMVHLDLVVLAALVYL
jgi:hypothetical protein